MDDRKVASVLRLIAVAVSLWLAGCGTQAVSSSQDRTADALCNPGFAQIKVHDGVLENFCGCDEAPGIAAEADAALVCTVPAGTQVVFLYQGFSFDHQILSVGDTTIGESAFESSGVSTTISPARVKAHAVLFSAVGRYPFEDAMNSLMRGQIIVR